MPTDDTWHLCPSVPVQGPQHRKGKSFTSDNLIFSTEGTCRTKPGSFQMIMSLSEADHHLDFLTQSLCVKMST